jgi:hypothetical protein
MVVELCAASKHVYCDFSYFIEMLGDQQAKSNVVLNLKKQLEGQRGEVLAKRFMYGSDWHMPEAFTLADDLLAEYQRIFEQTFPSNAARDFCGGNALGFLNLGQAVRRLRQTVDPAGADVQETLDYWESLDACVDSAPPPIASVE